MSRLMDKQWGQTTCAGGLGAGALYEIWTYYCPFSHLLIFSISNSIYHMSYCEMSLAHNTTLKAYIIQL